jgi:5-oxoprolinase (ATP-hydrolysing) subunit A
VVAIDLNSDLGESYGVWQMGDDAAMLEIVTSANVACGFHAGDPSVLRSACSEAVRLRVAIGAQVAYPDLIGFGRRHLDMEPDELRDAVLYQLGALDAFAQVGGSEIAYLKPHGALYHATATDPSLAAAVVAAAAEYDPSLAILGLPGSELLAAADEAGLEAVPEAFADRAYRPDGGLVSRREPGSVLTDADEVAARAVRLAVDQEVTAVDGTVVAVRARSLCVHSDTPGAVEIARAVRRALDAAGVGVRRFTDGI